MLNAGVFLVFSTISIYNSGLEVNILDCIKLFHIVMCFVVEFLIMHHKLLNAHLFIILFGCMYSYEG